MKPSEMYYDLAGCTTRGEAQQDLAALLWNALSNEAKDGNMGNGLICDTLAAAMDYVISTSEQKEKFQKNLEDMFADRDEQ